MWQKYKKYLVSSFVEASYNAKWCPGRGCNMIVANKTGASIVCQCSCGTRFCYGCLKAPHPPISCELLEKWHEVCEDQRDEEAELNLAWINANSKACPKCGFAIEKTYGCNWMTCSNCRHGFCWLCLGDAAAHPGRAGNHAR